MALSKQWLPIKKKKTGILKAGMTGAKVIECIECHWTTAPYCICIFILFDLRQLIL